MNTFNVEKFLALTALIAAATAAGCSSDNNNGSSGTGGSTSTGGTGTGGSSGSSGGGTGGTLNTGGTAGSGGTKTDAGLDGGTDGATPTACFGDTVAPADGSPDAGSESGPCDRLAYANDFCASDAGAEGYPPAGADLCETLQGIWRPGPYAALVKCLAAIPQANDCGSAHRAAALACYDGVVGNTCDTSVDTDGGTDPCAHITSACGGITPTLCHDTLRAFTKDARDNGIVSCILGSVGDGGPACVTTFWECILGPGVPR